jgi:hypothetical protein
MADHLRAVFQHGTFVPETPCQLPEGSQVVLTVSSGLVVPPQINDPAEKAAILRGIVERMRHNPLPIDAPRFSRDELHERR